jgi:hypothetical protein
VRESKAKSIAGLVKLMENFHDISVLLQPSTETQAPPGFQEWLESMRRIAAQYEFELRTELARLGGEMPEPRHEPASSLESGLKLAAEYYQHALNCVLTAHTRAMLVRQSEKIQRASEEFEALRRAA